jgi:molybdopterin molybdotransferase
MTVDALDRARALMGEVVEPLPPEHRAIHAAGGLRLAEAVSSRADLPAADVSAMDGYAGRFDEMARGDALSVAFEVPAGARPDPLPDGAVARLFTGALMPEGADTVVPQEQARVEQGRVVLEVGERGAFVRARGEVIAAGAPLAKVGELVTPPRAALLAAAGIADVPVRRRPWLGLVTTGAEVVSAEQEPGLGQIRDANGPLLSAAALEARLELVHRSQAVDDPAAVRREIERALAQAELVLVTGGVSVGDHDHVPAAVRELGGRVLFHRLKIKPGRPLLVARFGTRWMLGLPGNPLSCLVCWRLFGRPLVEALAGDAEAFGEAPWSVELGEDVANAEARTWLRPARLEGPAHARRVHPLGWKGSHDVASCAPANALMRIEPGAAHRAGEMVPVYPLAWDQRVGEAEARGEVP